MAVVALGVVAVDQVTKTWAQVALSDREPVELLGGLLTLRLRFDAGVAVNIGSDVTWVFTLLAAGAAAGIGYLALRVRSARWALAVGLLLGALVSQLADRLVRTPGFGMGENVDFLDAGGWFAGNLADLALGVGVAMVVALVLMQVPANRRLRTPTPPG